MGKLIKVVLVEEENQLKINGNKGELINRGMILMYFKVKDDNNYKIL